MVIELLKGFQLDYLTKISRSDSQMQLCIISTVSREFCDAVLQFTQLLSLRLESKSSNCEGFLWLGSSLSDLSKCEGSPLLTNSVSGSLWDSYCSHSESSLQTQDHSRHQGLEGPHLFLFSRASRISFNFCMYSIVPEVQFGIHLP